MEMYNLNVDTDIVGGYFSSEQIDLLSIVQCNSKEELIAFIIQCDQINHLDNIKEIINNITSANLDSSKREVFKLYQDTMVGHDESKTASRIRRLRYLGLLDENEITAVVDGTHPQSEEIMRLNHHFVSEERDQIKDSNLYEEMELLNSALPNFNSMLIGSGKIYNVADKLERDEEKKFDFYHAKRDLDFAWRNGKQVRYHSLVVKDDCGIFANKSKEEILELIKKYVKRSVDFINDYNSNHTIEVDGRNEPVINAVDLFNELVTFDEMVFDKEDNKWYKCKKIEETYKVIINENEEIYRDLKEGEVPNYQNIWSINYNISMDELLDCFKYAKENKQEGMSFLYNEPFLEDDKRRRKVFETLLEIDSKMPGLIDTLGSQMHITIDPSQEGTQRIERCFADFKKLQDATKKKIQITEFDMSIGSSQVPKVFGEESKILLEDVYRIKQQKTHEISGIINKSGVKLSGISYWSLTDGIDCNLERLRSNELKKKDPEKRISVQTACGGLIPTHKSKIKKPELNSMFQQQPKPVQTQIKQPQQQKPVQKTINQTQKKDN